MPTYATASPHPMFPVDVFNVYTRWVSSSEGHRIHGKTIAERGYVRA
jgi:hypothetical protein